MTAQECQMKIRIPGHMHEWIAANAAEQQRSLNGQIRVFLDQAKAQSDALPKGKARCAPTSSERFLLSLSHPALMREALNKTMALVDLTALCRERAVGGMSAQDFEAKVRATLVEEGYEMPNEGDVR